MTSLKALLRPFATMRRSLSLRKSFLAHLLVATLCALILSWGTLLVAANILQHLYNDSYGPTFEFIYNEDNGTLVSAETIDLSSSNNEFVPVYLPLESGKTTPVDELRGADGASFFIYGSSFSLQGYTRDIQDGGVAFGCLGDPYPPIVGLSARKAMDDYQAAMWEQFVHRLTEAPDSEAAQCYERALGSLPKTADEAKRLFEKAYGTALAAPFDYFSTSMYTEEDIAARKNVLVAAYSLIAIWFAFCFLFAGNRFYRTRLTKPLGLLKDAANRVAQENLDFTVSYEYADELGDLAASFETMRASLEATQRQLWQTAEDRKRLNAAFAHDLRTPLAVLKGRIEMLDIRAAEDEEDTIRVACKTLLTQVARLEGFVEVMSQLQKLEDRPVNKRPVKTDTLIKSLEETAEALSAETELSIDITVDPHSISLARPNASRDLDLFIDSPLVLEAIENLLSNALRFASNRVQLAISTTGDASLLKIAVSDDGPGFSTEAIERGCEPFYSTEKKNREESHFGIGLSTAKALCEKHGGCLKLLNLDDGASAIATFSTRHP